MENGEQAGDGGGLAFVYGTLRRHGSNHFRMAGAEFVAAATVRGKLYRIDWFPGVVLDETAGETAGEIYRVDDTMLAALDDYEGPEYRRVLTPVMPGAGVEPVLAWVWEWLLPVDERMRIASGDWLEK